MDYNAIDRVASQYATEVNNMMVRLAESIIEMHNQFDREEFLSIMSNINMETYILNEMGYQSTVGNLITKYQALLKDTPYYAPISENMLESLLDFEQATFLQNAGMLGNTVRTSVIQGLVGGMTRDMIVNSIVNLPNISRGNLTTLVTTAMSTFRRSVIRLQADFAPDEQKFFYYGPADGKTRDVCLEQLKAGQLTIKEIDKQFPGAFRDGGGYNCRHQWEPVTSSSRDLWEGKKANKLIDDRGDKYLPYTLQELYENKAN
jgi:hypothetical protein